MFSIRNSADRTEIDIIGSIGEGWFGEGNTLETVRNQFSEITNDITVNISSLGGDLIEALAIYDMFKMSNTKVTTNIIGATASAGTIIALGGDSIKISENSLFLGHKASMMVGGNAEDLRAAADDLDKFDSRLIAIYKKKTGKTKAEIENWLAEDKWITASEAKDFGLVDEIYKSKKVLNSVELDELSKIKELPQNYIQMDNNKTAVDTFLAKLGLQVIKAEVDVETLTAENEALKSELEALKATITETTTEKETIIEASKVSISDVEAKYTASQAEVATIKADLDKAQAELEKAKLGGFTVQAGVDPNPTGEPRKLTETEKVLAEILASVTDEEKLLYTTKNN